MKPRFSILSLLLGTAVVGIGIVAATSALQLRRNKQEAFTLRQRIEQLEAASSRRRAKIENEFVGAHPHPIVIIDPRVPKANPWIFRLVNSKYRGAGGTYWVGPPGQQDSRKRRIKFEIRLLRSLDNIDYYRLAHVVDGKPAEDLLFEYSGVSKLLLANETITIAISADREGCIAAAVSSYNPQEAERLRDAWTRGPYKPITREMNSTIIRPPRK